MPKPGQMNSMFDLKTVHNLNKEDQPERFKIIKSSFIENMKKKDRSSINLEEFVKMEQKLYEQRLKPVGQGTVGSTYDTLLQEAEN